MGGKSKTVNEPTRLTPEGQKQFDFAAAQLEDRFGQPVRGINVNRGGIQRGIRDLRNFGPERGTRDRINRLSAFRGTTGAKRSLEGLGNFKGSKDAFRTLGALENFGADQENFEGRGIGFLEETASGKFLTKQSGNPFIQDVIESSQRGVTENFNENVLPNLLAAFSGTGGVGSTLQAGFANQQARDLQRTLGDISSNISFDVFEAERGRQEQARQALLGFDQSSLDRLLQSRVSAGAQATDLSNQRLAALQGRAQGEVSLSDQSQRSISDAANANISLEQLRQRSLEGALQGETSSADLDFRNQQLNAQLENDRIAQLIAAQEAATAAGEVKSKKVKRSI